MMQKHYAIPKPVRAKPKRCGMCTKMTHSCLLGIHLLPTQRGEPVTNPAQSGFVNGSTDVTPVSGSQTKGRKKPVLMRFLQAVDNFHEKMTFSYRFVHACCIYPFIVDNDTGRKPGFRGMKQQRFNAFQGRVETFRRTRPRVLKQY